MSISRIEQSEKEHFGYYVRVTREGIQYSKFFADKKYGGKNGARVAAMELDAALQESYRFNLKQGAKRFGIPADMWELAERNLRARGTPTSIGKPVGAAGKTAKAQSFLSKDTELGKPSA